MSDQSLNPHLEVRVLDAPSAVLHDLRMPLAIMGGFTLLFLLALLWRIGAVDAERAQVLLEREQARLAAEAGVHLVLARLRSLAAQPVGDLPRALKARADDPAWRSAQGFERWVALSGFGEAELRVVGLRAVAGIDSPATPLVDESRRWQVEVEGRCGRSRATVRALFQFSDLTRHFTVFNSLNRYYYGQPLQDSVRAEGGLAQVLRHNRARFERGDLDGRGVIHDAALLVKTFTAGEADPFCSTGPARRNFGAVFSRGGVSPCGGTLYCEDPVVVDDHTFRGAFQTGSLFFRRGEALAQIEREQERIPLRSSRRVQMARGQLEGDPPGPAQFADRDTSGHPDALGSWHPDWAALRALARERGAYLDQEGKLTVRGQPAAVDLHWLPEVTRYTETYRGPVGMKPQQDVIAGPQITLASDRKFGGFNNLEDPVLRGIELFFSEVSVTLRGDLGSNLLLATPRCIFLTGNTNNQTRRKLFLLAGEGVVLDTSDLEAWVAKEKPDPIGLARACRWEVAGVLYKPGAGVTGQWAIETREQQQVSPVDYTRGQLVSLKISGNCLEGDLERWLAATLSPQAVDVRRRLPAVQVEPAGDPLAGLPLRPWAVSLLRVVRWESTP